MATFVCADQDLLISYGPVVPIIGVGPGPVAARGDSHVHGDVTFICCDVDFGSIEYQLAREIKGCGKIQAGRVTRGWLLQGDGFNFYIRVCAVVNGKVGAGVGNLEITMDLTVGEGCAGLVGGDSIARGSEGKGDGRKNGPS